MPFGGRLLACPQILDYGAVQERGTFRVHLEVEEGADFEGVARGVRREFEEMAARYELRPFGVQIERGLPSASPEKKRRRVQRLT